LARERPGPAPSRRPPLGPPIVSPSKISSCPPDRGPSFEPTARAIVVATPLVAAIPDRPLANSLLDCANNERPPSKPHSPVGRAVHAGRCGRHDRLGHRRRTDRSPAAGTSARITEMTSGCRRCWETAAVEQFRSAQSGQRRYFARRVGVTAGRVEAKTLVWPLRNCSRFRKAPDSTVLEERYGVVFSVMGVAKGHSATSPAHPLVNRP
jgi:hypothetical protein